MAKIDVWSEDRSKKEMKKRLQYAEMARQPQEPQWQENEKTIYTNRGSNNSPSASVSFETESELGMTDVDGSESDIGANYAFKNLRLIHSQLSANPPSVVARPTSNDLEDRRRADAADRLIRYAVRKYKLQEVVDQCTFNVLLYGSGFIKTLWDAEKGDPTDVDDEGTITCEGDISIKNVSPWRLFLDPDATCWEEVRYVFEEVILPYEEAVYLFCGGENDTRMKEILEKARLKDQEITSGYAGSSALNARKFDVVRIYEYWEKGTLYNGLIGRHCYCTREGELLTPMGPNPHRFKSDPESPMPAVAHLPYHQMTDFEHPSSVWGKAVLSYETPLQDAHNRMLNVVMDNLQAHGVARIILPEGAEISDESITNSPWDIIKMTGSQPPHFMEPMPMPAQINTTLEAVKTYIDDMAGVNESMFGQQSREQSGFSMQYATNQGNMIRHRLFNKYVALVEGVYKTFLNLVIAKWETPRTVKVLGKEKAFETLDLEGADINGGFDIVVEYGASLSLDPITRREEMITLMPLFEKAGVPTRTILQMLKLNELEGLYDRLQLAEDRQRELFEEMIARRLYIEPEELQDHVNMLEFSYNYVMSSEFKYLDRDVKELIKAHIRAREELAAVGAGTGAPSMGAVPGPLPGAGGPGAELPPPAPEFIGAPVGGPTDLGPLPGSPEGLPGE